MWVCQKCSAKVDDWLEQCWSCGSPPATIPSASESPPRNAVDPDIAQVERAYILSREHKIAIEDTRAPLRGGRVGLLGCAGLTVVCGILAALKCIWDGESLGITFAFLGMSLIMAPFAGGFGLLLGSAVGHVFQALSNNTTGSRELQELASTDLESLESDSDA